MPFYYDLAKNHPDMRVLVYNGDADPGINSFVSQNWTASLGLTETQSWRPWTLDGCQRMGGYVTRYEGDFDFLTIRGSGHMVPQVRRVTFASTRGAAVGFLMEVCDTYPHTPPHPVQAGACLGAHSKVDCG